MKWLIYVAVLGVSLILSMPGIAAIPMLLNYQGNVVDGTGLPVDGTGYFKFAIVNQAGDTAYWVNNGNTLDGSEPPNAVAIPVHNGVFSVKLGDTKLTNMAALTQTIFDNATIYLRVWFSTDNVNFEKFTGDIQILSGGFAFRAAEADTVKDSAVTSLAIQDNTITNSDINSTAAISASKIDTTGLDADTLDGMDSSVFALVNHVHNYAGSSSPGGPALDVACTSCIGTTDLAPDSVSASKIAASAVGTSEIANAAVTSVKLASDSVGASQIAASAVGTSEILDNSITNNDISASAGISASKLANGAGARSASGTGNTSLSTTDATVMSITISAPSTGFAIVNTSGYYLFGAAGYARCSITTGTTVSSTGGSYIVASGDPTNNIVYVPFASTYGFTITSTGPQTYRLVCNLASGTISVIWPKMTAMFFPTQY